MRRFALKLITWTSCIVISAAVVGAQTPSVPDGGIVNAASYAKGQAVSPGALVAIFGSELASGIALADSIPLSTSRLDVSVTFNGVPAPLHFVSPGQINAQMPWNVLPAGVVNGTANVVVKRGSASSTSTVVQVTQAAPGIFSIPPGAGYAVAINPDGTLAAPVAPSPARTPGLRRSGKWLSFLRAVSARLTRRSQTGRTHWTRHAMQSSCRAYCSAGRLLRFSLRGSARSSWE